ncbi:hypothetical protein U5A82_09210 [Sphingobium sp. CR2-8]|uniref:hypothetical protein n=1 Tax=Sphingobium sp. CR2-8 TaxID=1306534 RepID=UPI002DBE02A3|nr:hypothetical protein [Sphingobium sp. CR2-8]MEC3910651.1 hypothetical protein [Sphingobium sp. CR2-8]
MAQTSAFCLTQQSLHQARALSETLPNARNVAQRAANAWGREAELAIGAERRRATRSVLPEDEMINAEFRAEEAVLQDAR